MAPTTLLIATLISITLYNTNSEVINCQGDCKCATIQSTESCTLNCATADSCKKSTLTCAANRPCSIYCTDSSSCADFTHINAALATDVLVVCDADDACKAHSTILCGTGDCHLVCGTPTACEEIGIVDVSKATSFTCNDCPPGTANLQFTANPTKQPTQAPSAPTKTPSTSPTNHPTKTPSTNPSFAPTKTPTHNPTTTPTQIPTKTPTNIPTKTPSLTPTTYPTAIPTSQPTRTPSSTPTKRPTVTPTAHPIATPTASPTTDNPTISPVKPPTNYPTIFPTTNQPTTADPTHNPSTANPTNKPSTYTPTTTTSARPTKNPTQEPTEVPTPGPSQNPSPYPTQNPSVKRTNNPSMQTTNDRNINYIVNETEDVNRVYSKISDDNSNTLLIPMISMALSVFILAVIICVCWSRKKRRGMEMISDDVDGEQENELMEIVKEGTTKSGVNDYLVRVHYNKKQLDFILNGSTSGQTNDCGWDENTFDELNTAIKKTFNITHGQFGLHEIVDDCFVNIDDMDDIAASFVDTNSKTMNLVVKCENDSHVGRKSSNNVKTKVKLSDSEYDSASMSLI